MDTTIHFGVRVRSVNKYLKLTRDNYVVINKYCTTRNNYSDYLSIKSEKRREAFLEIFEDKSATTYTDAWCEKQRDRALHNYDLNMRFIGSLNQNDFLEEVNRFHKSHNEFINITDLNLTDKKSGYYILILDNHCQLYVGTSINIKKRIMSHWSKRKAFDRLIFGNPDNSVLSIDSFGALDTSRIFAYFTDDLYTNEDKYIKFFSPKFCVNRTGGGIPEFGALSIVANSKHRDLS